MTDSAPRDGARCPCTPPDGDAAALRTRRRIVAAAHSLFVEAGYDATSVWSIARTAGVAEEKVHLHFETKPAILEAVLEPTSTGIDVKAMIIVPSRDRLTHAVSLMPPTAEHPRGYHRLIGGRLESGETHEEAIRREVREELGAHIRDLAFLEVVENIFDINGVPGHEVVFVHTGRLDPEPEPAGAPLIESDGSVFPVVWRPFEDSGEPLPVFPDGIAHLANCRHP
ncbi:MAG: NUDIX domain-containing protein [Ornithinibacter sp.]